MRFAHKYSQTFFVVLALRFRSIRFEFIFVYGLQQRSNSILLNVDIQLLQFLHLQNRDKIVRIGYSGHIAYGSLFPAPQGTVFKLTKNIIRIFFLLGFFSFVLKKYSLFVEETIVFFRYLALFFGSEFSSIGLYGCPYTALF